VVLWEDESNWEYPSNIERNEKENMNNWCYERFLNYVWIINTSNFIPILDKWKNSLKNMTKLMWWIRNAQGNRISNEKTFSQLIFSPSPLVKSSKHVGKKWQSYPKLFQG
jgi:hypothetical protein